MSAIYNIYKTIYLNSSKSSNKTIFSKPTINNSYCKNLNFPQFKNISLIKPKLFMTQKRAIKKNFLKSENFVKKMKFFSPIQVKSKNNKINYNRNNFIFSPTNIRNNLRKKLIYTNNSNSYNISLSKASIEQKNHKKIKNENKILINYKKEKNKLSNLISEQKNEIEKLKNKNKLYNKKLLLLEKENKMLNTKIDNYHNTQSQLILLIKIIQNYGVDINQLIDDYNNSISSSTTNNLNDIKGISDSESLSEIDLQIESNSFFPINIERKKETTISKIKIPKLNFDNINKKNTSSLYSNIFNKIHNK